MPPLFLIERNFAEELNVTSEIAGAIKQVNMDVDIDWLFSFLSADKRKTYCLYETKNPEAIREAAKRAGRPVAIMADFSGPKMRIGKLDVEPIQLKAGDHFSLTPQDISGNAQRVSVSFARLVNPSLMPMRRSPRASRRPMEARCMW